MGKYRKKPVVIEAITFDELVNYGKMQAENLVNGMPWSFSYGGHPITHENDDCYLIPTPEGTMKFNRGDMLITGVAGEIYPCKPDIFEATYEPLVDSSTFRLGDEMCPKRADDVWHCWHVRELLLTTPPQEKQVCCWCGMQRIVRDEFPRGEHGPHVDWQELRMVVKPG